VRQTRDSFSKKTDLTSYGESEEDGGGRGTWETQIFPTRTSEVVIDCPMRRHGDPLSSGRESEENTSFILRGKEPWHIRHRDVLMMSR
jgi:hypothetical protein